MKTILACICFIIVASNLKAENKTILSSKIKNVTVFLNGAQVNREANVSLTKGIFELSFDSLSPNINSNSIQVSGKGNFIILNTKYLITQPDYNNQQTKLPEQINKLFTQINDSIEQVGYDLEELKFNKDVLEAEKQLLISNKSMKSDSLALLKDALSFFREKYNDINTKLIQTKKIEAKQQKRLAKLQEKLNKLNQEIALNYTSKPLKPNYKVVVTVKSDLTTTGKISLNYMVANASWSPSYDIRANQLNEPITLTYKAVIHQNSGENWDDVKLKLSTNNPYKSKVKPVLPTWYINYYNSYNQTQTTTFGGVAKPSMAREMEDKKSELSDAETSAYYTTITESFTNVEFNISIPYSIPSDGEQHTVAVKEESLKSDFKYYMVPKMDNNAFLIASIKGFEELNLLPASANIYFDGTYIGQTMINPAVTGDSLNIDLGREERISVKRTALKIEEKDKLLGSDKVRNYGFELLIKNNLLADINLIVEDQIPVSSDKEIKVELKNKDNATVNENTGMLVWKINLTAKESKKIKFNYEVQCPKDKQLALR